MLFSFKQSESQYSTPYKTCTYGYKKSIYMYKKYTDTDRFFPLSFHYRKLYYHVSTIFILTIQGQFLCGRNTIPVNFGRSNIGKKSSIDGHRDCVLW